MVIDFPLDKFAAVALRKESVDRNSRMALPCGASTQSLSARRAWIEIGKSIAASARKKVALRKESVDRNWRPLLR